MKLKGHFITYCAVIGILSIIEVFTHYFGWKIIFKLFCAFFLVNPDYDLIFGIKNHRNWFFHSFLYPLSIYLVYRDHVNMDTADMFGVILFLPCLVHLICDFRIKEALDFKDQRNSWCISAFGKRWNEPQSYTWVGFSVLFMIIYMLLVFTGYWSVYIDKVKILFGL